MSHALGQAGVRDYFFFQIGDEAMSERKMRDFTDRYKNKDV